MYARDPGKVRRKARSESFPPCLPGFRFLKSPYLRFVPHPGKVIRSPIPTGDRWLEGIHQRVRAASTFRPANKVNRYRFLSISASAYAHARIYYTRRLNCTRAHLASILLFPHADNGALSNLSYRDFPSSLFFFFFFLSRSVEKRTIDPSPALGYLVLSKRLDTVVRSI